MRKRRKREAALSVALALSAILCLNAFAAEQTPAAGAVKAKEAAEKVTSIEAHPVKVDQNFSFEEDAEYIIVSTGSANPVPFAMRADIKDSNHIYAAQAAYDEETGILSLKDTDADISACIWEAQDTDDASAYLYNRASGKRLNFSKVSFSMDDIGTAVSAGLDGRIYLGANNGTDYYLVCQYYQYTTPVDYYFGAGMASSAADSSGMPMTIFQVKPCEHADAVCVETVAPACTEEGYDVYQCPDCGRAIKRNRVPAAGHHFKNGICTVCGVKDAWDGESKAAWANGSGTKADPYLIENEAMLAYLAAKVNNGETYANQYFKMTKDLDLDSHAWTPISNTTTATSFAGSFDGGGHTIKNLYISKSATMPALFGTVGASASQHAEIKNLIIQGKNDSERGYAAGLAAYAGNVTITNVGNEVDVAGRYACGGLVGYQYNLTTTITGCYNKGTITANEYQRTSRIQEGSGGLVGNSYGTLVIRDSYNAGDINIDSTQYGNAGGLVGYANNLSTENVYNYGSVAGGYSAGSILGYGTITSAEQTYYLRGSASAVNGYASGGTGNAAAYTSNKTLLSNLSEPFVDGTDLNEIFSGSPALSWEYPHKHVIADSDSVIWNWSEDYSSCTATFVCSGEDCYGTKEPDGTFRVTEVAEVTVTEEQKPACDTEGKKVYTATVAIDDGLTLTDVKTVSIPATGHTMKEYPAKAPTYRTGGNIAYHQCITCKKYFADEAGTQELEKDAWLLPKLTSAYAAGDVTRDGLIDGRDAALILRFLSEKTVPDAEQEFLADYTNDGDVTIQDVIEIRTHSIGTGQ